MSDTVKKLHLTPGQMRDAVARAAEDVKTLPPWREPKETTMAQRSEVGPTIRARREKLGLTQDWLAREVGCAFAVVSRWENGHAVPRQKFAEALVRSLGGVVSDYRDR